MTTEERAYHLHAARTYRLTDEGAEALLDALGDLPPDPEPEERELPAVLTERTCRGCGKTYPLTMDYFHRDGHNRHGLKLDCKACERQRKDHR